MADLSSPSSAELFTQPGYLYITPTDLTSPPGGFGTQLGFSERGVEFFPGYNVATAPGEEYGEELVVKVFIGAQARIRTIFKSWNANVFTQAFPGLFESAKANARFPGDVESGQRLDNNTYAKTLLFAPRDSGEHNKILIAQYAVPNFPETESLNFRLNDPSVFSVTWDLFRRDGGSDKRRSWFVGDIDDSVII